MTNPKLIMFVCRGNNYRSPIAESAANLYLKERGLENQFQAVSSGVDVNRLFRGDYKPEEMLGYLNFAQKVGWDFPEARELRAQLEEGGLVPNYRFRSSGIIKKLLQNERVSRDQVLKEINFPGKLKPKQEQLTPRTDVELVLPVDAGVCNDTITTYSRAGLEDFIRPRIHHLNQFALNNGTAHDINADAAEASSDYDDVLRKQAEYITLTAVPFAMKRFLAENHSLQHS